MGACHTELEGAERTGETCSSYDPIRRTFERVLYSRGAPSAISIAVIPQDHRSLYGTNHHNGCSYSISCSSRDIKTLFFRKHALCMRLQFSVICQPYPVVVGSIGVFITSNNLWSHPIWSPNKGVPTPHCPVQLGADAKVH